MAQGETRLSGILKAHNIGTTFNMEKKGQNCPGSNDLRGGLTLMRGVFLVLLVGLAGCFQIDPETLINLKQTVEALAENNASACGQVTAGGGGGAIAILPMPGGIPAGGYGYGSAVVCRTNEPGSVISVHSDGITIFHGVYKADVKEKELKDLKERLKKFEEIPPVFFVPNPPTEF